MPWALWQEPSGVRGGVGIPEKEPPPSALCTSRCDWSLRMGTVHTSFMPYPAFSPLLHGPTMKIQAMSMFLTLNLCEHQFCYVGILPAAYACMLCHPTQEERFSRVGKGLAGDPAESPISSSTIIGACTAQCSCAEPCGLTSAWLCRVQRLCWLSTLLNLAEM